ncbi:PspC domain-containing protein [Actinomadura madurae]|uniref:PspC domain-containing protein n=1 Tax=Actinomadura madurae TaxID=1993 RepID=UPI00202600AB|nr:PspC domain-containing protein [Actinomadura madurae]MCP9950416.1 PspC domain-containing protein [Actinomadura madurae]MCP9967196.1 PspC domain-containing protein [Actinomadura madurae]MCP9979659.1 PspC domain-containing protein [Actinomadura madurae]MCQ0008810.1 PspC domain-containing protein [Actinomadura madurae]MCQ0015875.1 PspC domain-containing protein [Actinomadura madurae]
MNSLYRPRNDRVIAGVCAGLARRFGMTPWTVRLLFLLSCLLPGPQFVVYLVLWVMMPNEDRTMARAH